MKLSVNSFLLPKAGLESHECEDSIGIRSNVMRYCIADGATEGFGSRRWSKLLTKYWVKSQDTLSPEQFNNFVIKLAERFGRYWRNKTLPWYAEEKAHTGAFAAFVGVQFNLLETGLDWQSIAQGDCCIFQIRNKKVICASPLKDADQFNNNPVLIASDITQHIEQQDLLVQCRGTAQTGDHFLLMSDAIAAWFLKAVVSDGGVNLSFYQMLAHNDEAGFKALIDFERSEKRLKNDDVAVVQISVTRVE